MALPTHISDATRRLNPQIFSTKAEQQRLIAAPVDHEAKKRLRQKSGPKLNPTEESFGVFLRATMLEHDHYAQSVTFVLANGVRFTPDWVSISHLTGYFVVHEVKGFMRDDAAVKVKVAASKYPHVAWRLATKRKKSAGGGWDVQDVLA